MVEPHLPIPKEQLDAQGTRIGKLLLASEELKEADSMNLLPEASMEGGCAISFL